ncbi:phosphotransferase family protein [Idiomarina sp. A28L]|uniref:phosphotransferase n=1 Tax=Idiomarina sp. A28L TaxID=1036674 RepID=UPI0002138B97|nr:phosphotransferase [Idiomarina sp. A28L]EGN75385.1 phosphotransferase family protein [Idiomarina sp. A28L]
MAFPTWCLAHLPVHGVWKTRSVGEDLANSTWCIESDEHCFLVKQYAHDSAFGRITGEAVATDIKLAELGIAPAIIFADSGRGVVITEWLSSEPLAAIFDPEARAQKLGLVQQQIHQLTPDIKPWSLWQRVMGYCDALEQLEPRLGAQSREDCESYKDLFAAWQMGPRVFCHHDLNAEHVYPEPEPRVIDWEYAGYGHPGFDVASTIVINDFYDDEIEVFLEAYNAEAQTPVAREELRDWIRLIALINRIWFALQNALANDGDS